MKMSLWRKLVSAYFEEPVARLLAKLGFSPNSITILGLVGAVVSSYLAAEGFFLAAGVVMLIAGILDLLDGTVARITDRKTRFGALLDSTVDRVSEASILFGLAVFYMREPNIYGVLLSYFGLVGSFMVSYVRARAGGLRIDCEIGIFPRPTRVALLGIGLIIGQWWEPLLLIVLVLISGLTAVTTLQRVLHVRNELE